MIQFKVLWYTFFEGQSWEMDCTLPLLISATLFFFFFEKENIYFSAATKWMLIYLESNKTFMENSLWYSFI